MEERKTDRRILKTKKAIYAAFTELILVKNVNDITIKDIADAADINRKTFYNYYNGVFDLVDEIEMEIANSFGRALNDVTLEVYLQTPYLVLAKLNSIISKDFDFYGRLLRSDCNNALITKLISALKNKVKEKINVHVRVDETLLNLVLDYTATGILAVYQSWFASDRKMSMEQLADYVSSLAFNGINSILKRLD